VTAPHDASQPPATTGPSVEVRAVLAALLGSSLVGSVPMFATGLYQSGMDVSSLLFWRYWIAMSVLAPLAFWYSPNLSNEWQRGGQALFFNAATLGALQTFTYFRAIQGLPSSVVVTIFFTYPVLTLAIDRIVFRKHVPVGSAVAAGLVFLGALFVGWPSLTLQGGDPIAIACAIATPIAFSIYIAIAYRFTRETSAFAGAASIYFGLACTYTLVVIVAGLTFPGGVSGWGAALFIGILGGVVQISSFAYALPRLSAGAYSIVISMELVTVVLLGVLVLGEQLSAAQGLGVALVVTGMIADRIARSRAAAAIGKQA
jgi:drug/metabolite transporter (DMT)-like permease